MSARAGMEMEVADAGWASRPDGTVGNRGRGARVVPRSARFDWIMAILSCWFVGGLFLDAWAHIHLSELETFFTPWHGVLYSGFLAVVAFTAFTLVRNRAAGYSWLGALPVGYGASLLGIAIFFAGGVGDMIWHELFGVEADLEAAVSPTHLLLFTGLALILVGPFQSIRYAADGVSNRLVDRLPALMSLAFIMTLFGTVTGYANPFTRVMASDTANQDLGLISIAWYAVVVMGPILLAVQRYELPMGSLTFVLGLHAALQGAVDDALQFVPAALLAGLISDLALRGLRSRGRRDLAPYVLGFAMPVVFFSLYFATVQITEGIAWSIHLWAGAIALAGLFSLWFGFLIAQAGQPREQPSR